MSHALSLVIGLLIALPLLYVLSVGPVALYYTKMHRDPMAIRQFYLPVVWLHDHTVLKKPLEMYLELWGVH